MRSSSYSVWLAIVLATSPAAAQRHEPDSAAAKAAARPLAEQGHDRFERGAYDEAIALFLRAEAHYHAPGHLLFIARAHAHRGRLVKARDTYRAIVDEALPDYAPAAFREAQRDARRELAELRKRIPKLVIAVSAAGVERARVWLDGGELPEATTPIEVDPGGHEVRAEARQRTASRHVEVAEGETLRVRLELSGPDEPRRAGVLLPIGIASLGVAGVGVVAGTVTGVLSFQRVGELEEQCPSRVCSPDLAPLGDEALALGDASTASFVVAGIAAAAGTTLLVVGHVRGETLSVGLGPAEAVLTVSF